MEGPDDLVGAAQPEGAQEHRGQELPLPVDADVEQVLGVVLELDPRAAIREWKKAPGDRCSCETMTRSVPLMMNVPFSVISGMSPK